MKPKHVAIIPDGNRRYAQARGKKPWQGHERGAQTFRELLEWCKKEGIKELTFWGASTDNLERSTSEVKTLFALFGKMCDEIIRKHKRGELEDVKIRIIGDRSKFPSTLRNKMHKVEHLTTHNTNFRLNLLLGYGGRQEIIAAAKSIAEKVKTGRLGLKNIDEKEFKRHLMIESEPDLVIRTSQQRLSGLMPFQTIYSEIIFLPKTHWPEFTARHFKKCLTEYSRRKRTYGL